MKFINESAVKKYIKEQSLNTGVERRVSKEFLMVLDEYIAKKLRQAVAIHNGGRKTLNSDVAAFIGLK